MLSRADIVIVYLTTLYELHRLHTHTHTHTHSNKYSIPILTFSTACLMKQHQLNRSGTLNVLSVLLGRDAAPLGNGLPIFRMGVGTTSLGT